MRTLVAQAAPSLADAVRALASRCDHAETLDGQGYNATDQHFGHHLALLPACDWTPEMAADAHDMLRTYRAQLAGFGIDYDALPAPELPEPPAHTGGGGVAYHRGDGRAQLTERLRAATAARKAQERLEREWHVELGAEGRLSITSPYNSAVITAAKRCGGRWNREAKKWLVPADRAADLARALATFPFTWLPSAVGAAVAAALAGPPAEPAAPTHAVSRARDAELYEVRFDYDPNVVRAIRKVSGAKWNKDDKLWTVPVTAASARSLAAFVREHSLSVAPGLDLEKVAAEADRLVETSRALDAVVPTTVPLQLDPYPFQRAGIAYSLATRRTFIADEMGLGKTIQALGAISAADAYPAVVVAPAKMRAKWAREAKKWLPEGTRVAVVLPRSASKRETFRRQQEGISAMVGKPRPGADVYVTNYDGLPGQLGAFVALAPQALVLDESHLVKNRSKRTACPFCDATVKKKKRGQVVVGCMGCGKDVDPIKVYSTGRTRAAWELSRVIPGDGLRLCLSGTPNKNHVEDFVSQLDILDQLDAFGGEWRFLRRFCGGRRTDFGYDSSGASNLDELNDLLRATCFIRRRKADVLPDLPPLRREVLPLQLPEAALADYRQAEADILEYLSRRAAELAAEAGEDGRAASWQARMKAESAKHLVQMSTLRTLVAAAKADAVAEWVEEFLADTDRKLVVFAHHLEVMGMLAERFGCARVDGTVSGDVSDAAVAAFQEDPSVRLILVGITAGGVGLTLTAASDELFVEQAWTPADLDQAEARCYGRVNDAHGANATYLLAEDTVDDDMAELLEEKREIFHAAADGDPIAKKAAQESVLGDMVVRLAERGLAARPNAKTRTKGVTR